MGSLYCANENPRVGLFLRFFLGLNPDTETVAVGIRVQDRRDGIHHVGPADGLRHLPKPMISLVKVLMILDI